MSDSLWLINSIAYDVRDVLPDQQFLLIRSYILSLKSHPDRLVYTYLGYRHFSAWSTAPVNSIRLSLHFCPIDRVWSTCLKCRPFSAGSTLKRSCWSDTLPSTLRHNASFLSDRQSSSPAWKSNIFWLINSSCLSHYIVASFLSHSPIYWPGPLLRISAIFCLTNSSLECLHVLPDQQFMLTIL